MILKCFHIMLIFLLLTACGDGPYHSQLELLYRHSVSTISADSLFRLMEEPGLKRQGAKEQASFVLLDTRDRHEWQLSHIPDAQWSGFENFTLNLPHIPDPDMPVVLYCTIGYRSEQIGEQLAEAGYSNVSHLYGGIIEWKNNSYPIVNDNARATDSVHTYDRYWGMFLKKGIPVYE